MRFDDLNWFDIETYLKKDDRIIFILGACEQHGYLSLTTDVQIPQALADAASQKTGVLVAPTLNFGVSPYFLQYPGTISIRISTLLDIIEDVTRSVHQHGFKKILFLNGHGGNTTAQSRLYELANQLPDLKLAWYAWWQSQSVTSIAQKYDLKPTHASWLEAFQFTRVSDLPEGTKAPPYVPGLMNSWQAKEIYGDGNFGGPYSVSPHIMEEIFNTALNDILFLLKFENNQDNPTR